MQKYKVPFNYYIIYW